MSNRAAGQILNTLKAALAPHPSVPEEEAGHLVCFLPLSRGPVDGSFYRFPLASYTSLLIRLFHNHHVLLLHMKTKVKNQVTDCHLDYLDQHWTTEHPTMMGMYKSELSHVTDPGHVWLLSTGMWPVLLRNQSFHLNLNSYVWPVANMLDSSGLDSSISTSCVPT